MSFSDCSYMRRALELAKKARFNCPPNPAVGCVIVKDRRIIGEGFTQKTGEAHAEVMALRDAASRGESVAGATVYVTLEPRYGSVYFNCGTLDDMIKLVENAREDQGKEGK